MSFKSEAAKVKSNIAAGAYKEKTNVWGGFFDELAYGVKKQDEEERQERLEARREARANGRMVKAKQDAQDKQDKKDTALANLWITSNAVDPTAQNMNSVLGVVRDGGFSGISDLTTFMDKTSTVKRAVPPAPAPSVPTPIKDSDGTMRTFPDGKPVVRKVDEEKSNAEILETRNNNSGIDIDPDMIQFGVQTEPYDLESVTENNYLGKMRTEELSGNAEAVAQIKEVAAANGWDKKINGIPHSSMVGEGSNYFADLLADIDKETAPEDYEWVNTRLAAATAREAEPNFWQDDTKLSNYDANTLEAFLSTGNYAEGSEAYKAINGFLEIRLVQEGKAGIETLIGADPQKIDQYIKANAGRLSAAEKNTLTDMRSIAEEYAEKGKESATAKQRALAAYVEQTGANSLEANPRMELMAEFEKGWKVATSTAEVDKKFWQKPDALAKMTPIALKTLMDSGLIGGPETEAFKAVNAAYGARDNLETGNLDQLIGKSVLELDQYFNNNAEYFAKPENAKKLTKFTRLKSLAVESERAGQTEKTKTAKQISLDAFIVSNQLDTLKPEEVQAKMSEFEKNWAASIKTVEETQGSYTTANYSADIIKFSKMLNSSDVNEVKEATDWFSIEQPIIQSTLSAASTINKRAEIDLLIEGGIPEDMALAIATGSLKITSDGFGRPITVNTGTGETSSITGETTGEASSRVNTASLTTEEIQELEVAKLELEEALAEAGFSGRINDLEDIAAAFGPEGFTGKIVNTITGVFNKTGMKDSAEATSTLNALGKVTKFNIISGFAGLRDSVSLKAEIETLLPKSGQFFSSKPDALRNFKDIKALLDQAMLGQENIATRGTGISTTAESKANVALESLRPLSELYAKVIKSMEGDGKSNQVTGSVFIDGQLEPKREAFIPENPPVKNSSGTAPDQAVFVADFLRLNKDNPKATEIEALRQFKNKYPDASANKFTTSDGKTFSTGAEAAAHQSTLGE